MIQWEQEATMYGEDGYVRLTITPNTWRLGFRVDGQLQVLAEGDVPKEVPRYDVWIEGYSATGNHDTAHHLGSFQASTFAEAVDRALTENGWNKSHFNPERLTYWGCRFFNNEDDARKAFG